MCVCVLCELWGVFEFKLESFNVECVYFCFYMDNRNLEKLSCGWYILGSYSPEKLV